MCRRRRHRFAIAGEPREDDVDHRARSEFVRTYGVEVKDEDHVLADSIDGWPVLPVKRLR